MSEYRRHLALTAEGGGSVEFCHQPSYHWLHIAINALAHRTVHAVGSAPLHSSGRRSWGADAPGSDLMNLAMMHCVIYEYARILIIWASCQCGAGGDQ